MDFFKGKNVFITGSTGFKGSWLSKVLSMKGANVTGYALKPETQPALFDVLDLKNDINSVIGDIRDIDFLSRTYKECNPDIVFHLAAQPLVRESYNDPAYTYETNVMGTVNILECIRKNTDKNISIVNVTTDKVYKNKEWLWGYRENEELDGYDPYSNSKSCSELVTASYNRSFFEDAKIPVSALRAGNVIGGGDWAKDRIIPDCIRAAVDDIEISVRNPNSIRPYQHVIEPIFAYLMVAKKQYEDYSLAGTYNIGPETSDCVTTSTLADIFCDAWGDGVCWNTQNENGPHEANFLKLDCSKIKAVFNWKPLLNVKSAVQKTVEFSKAYYSGMDTKDIIEKQVLEYEQLIK